MTPPISCSHFQSEIFKGNQQKYYDFINQFSLRKFCYKMLAKNGFTDIFWGQVHQGDVKKTS